MILKTNYFGEIEINEEDIITFADGIPGFEDLSKYLIIENSDKDVPFKWLQSVDDSNLTFVIINPFAFKEDYEFELPKNVIKKLNIKSHEDIKIYTIVIVPEDVEKMTANLAAPIVINAVNKKGKQVLLEDSPYHKRHLILEEMKKSILASKKLEEEKTARPEEAL